MTCGHTWWDRFCRLQWWFPAWFRPMCSFLSLWRTVQAWLLRSKSWLRVFCPPCSQPWRLSLWCPYRLPSAFSCHRPAVACLPAPCFGGAAEPKASRKLQIVWTRACWLSRVFPSKEKPNSWIRLNGLNLLVSSSKLLIVVDNMPRGWAIWHSEKDPPKFIPLCPYIHIYIYILYNIIIIINYYLYSIMSICVDSFCHCQYTNVRPCAVAQLVCEAFWRAKHHLWCFGDERRGIAAMTSKAVGKAQQNGQKKNGQKIEAMDTIDKQIDLLKHVWLLRSCSVHLGAYSFLIEVFWTFLSLSLSQTPRLDWLETEGCLEAAFSNHWKCFAQIQWFGSSSL